MIGIVLLAAMQATSADRIAFACQDDRGDTFALFIPAVLEEGEAPDPAAYTVEGVEVSGDPATVIDELPEKLSLYWPSSGGPEVTLEIVRYDVIGRAASYRLRRESPPDAAISWTTFSAGQCLGRRVGGNQGQQPAESDGQ